MMDAVSSEVAAPQLKALNDTMNQVKVSLDLIDDKTLVWQRRLECKLDQLLKYMTPQQQQLRAVQNPPVALPGVVLPAWSDGSTVRGDSEQICMSDVGSPLALKPSHVTDAGFEELMTCSPHSHTTMMIESPSGRYVTGKTTVKSPSSRGSYFNESLKKRIQSGVLPVRNKSLFFSSEKKRKKAESFVLSKKRLAVEDANTWLFRFTTAKRYEVGVLLLIILNSIFIGWQVQVVAYRVEDAFQNGTAYDVHPPDSFFALQTIFCITFVIELALRWLGEGILEFVCYSPDMLWNWFDIVTVGSGLVEVVIELSSSDARVVASISTIRVLRVLRVVRLLKLIRTYPFFHELRMMVESCLNSLKSYMWCVLVLLLLTYLFAISMTTGACSYLSEGDKVYDSSDANSARLYDFFGTLDRSMLSLFQTIAGGRDWFEFYDVLVLLDFHKKWLYLLYISFTMFAVCNVVAAVFVESAMQSSAHDRELLIREQLKDSQDYCQKMMAVFEEMDEDGTGTISEEEFLSHLDDDRVKAYFNSMKLDVSDAASLFKLLDVDRSGSVEIMEFIEGCQKLKGESRTLDMHLMRYELHSMRHELHDMCLKFYKFAEVKGVAYLRDMRLASKHKLDSPSSALRKTASAPADRSASED